jgi:RimJ/RimL family protein N-acetyltransferase
LGVERVYATTMVVNVASRRVMEKAGLRYIRTLSQPWPYPIEGDEHGDVEYALVRAEWEAERSEQASFSRLAWGKGAGQGHGRTST